ncbi:hypothetical protein [Sphingomonas sp. MS122]|uniref:hypothetical protein n=1 Tax=Sphingomonas sp. MS122 TaxID=3412683 RepID=UPI003C2B9F3B
MIVAFDASALVYLLDESAAPPKGEDGQPISNCQARVSHLIAELQRTKSKIVIPAPSLAEVLVYGGAAAADWLSILNTSRHISIAPFDERAAIEYAVMERERLNGPGKLSPRAKAKFDHQIVAIARVEGAGQIYSDDSDIRRLWSDDDQVIGVSELPLPPEEAQLTIEFDPDINDDAQLEGD